MKNKKILAVILTLITLVLNCSSIVFATSGTETLKSIDILGGGVVYRYDSSTKTATISKEMSGNGCTFNYAESPFYNSDVETVIINDGVIQLTRALFYGAKKLKKITIPNSVTFLGTSTFEGCSSLTDITIPNSVKEIGYNVFRGCKNLKSIKIPSSVSEMGSYAFFQCSNLTNLTVEAGTNLKTIPHGAFQECTYLKQVSIGSGITELAGRVFEDCRNLTYISLPDTITSIGAGAFRNCIKLKTAKLSENLQEIQESAFSDCSMLKAVNLPQTLLTIGDYAFSQCKNLTDITIPTQIESIGQQAFRDCGNIYVDENSNHFACDDCILYSKDKSRLLHCSTSYQGDYAALETITGIDNYAFSNCTSLTQADLSTAKITQIPSGIFYNCTTLERVVIPNGITKINSAAFYNNQNLSAVVIPETVNTISYNVFNNNNVVGKFINEDISTVNFSSSNNLDNVIFAWKAVSLGTASEISDETTTFSVNVDETNPIKELKYEIGEQDKQYFELNGQNIENKEIIIPQGTDKISLYSKDVGGNETVNVCTVPAFNLPTADEITYGQALGDSSLFSAAVGDISGVWTWQDPDIIPNAGTNTYAVVFTPNDTQNYNPVTAEIPVTVNKATPDYVVPDDITTVYSPTLTLADIELPDDWSWVEGDIPLYAQENAYTAIFTPTDTENYKSITEDIFITVEKATPDYVIPTDLTAVYSPTLTLTNIKLPDGFSWNEPDTRLCVPGGEYTALYTPEDTENYNTAELTLNVTITKYTPIIGVDIQLPTASDITYGQKLADSVLISSEEDKVEGEWSWVNSEAAPSEVENILYSAVFVSDDSANYETVVVEIPVPISDNVSDDNKQSDNNGDDKQEKPSHNSGSSGGGHSRKPSKVNSTADTSDKTDKANTIDADNNKTEEQIIKYDLPYITGYDDNTFRPNAKITRAEAITAIARAAKITMNDKALSVFLDVNEHWAKNYIDTASSLNIIDGYDDKTFRPDNNITRAEFAKIIAEFTQKDIPNKSAEFSDTKNHWAEKYIAILTDKKIITGYDGNKFKPDALITRAEAVTIINRAVIRNSAPDIKMSFIDVTKTHWAYNEILQAAGKQ